MPNTFKEIETAVILAGGKGTRLSEHTHSIPKPLVKVDGEAIILHIMRRLALNGIKEIYILSGYLHCEMWSWLISIMDLSMIFPNYFNKEHICVKVNDPFLKDCLVHLVYTGEEAGTAERLYQMKDVLIEKGKPFIMTYGDTYSDLDISMVEKQLKGDKILSLCAVPYTERFGLVKVEEDGSVSEFREKSESKTHFINGGFICMTLDIFDILKKEHFDFSKDTLESPELKGKIGAYIYNGYWKPVDTQRDLNEINKYFKEQREKKNEI